MKPAMTRVFTFIGGTSGPWKVEKVRCLAGAPMRVAERISVRSEPVAEAIPERASGATWVLSGATSNDRYVERHEKSALADRQQGLGRAAAVCAALIPIRKTVEWWLLAQDERRAIFEAQSRHIAIGMEYLPAIARRLHHCRDLGLDAPFDFLTWFEFAPEDEAAFESLLLELRASAEWQYVDREIEFRLRRDPL